MPKSFTRLVWLLPLLLHAGDVFAWGLLTHVYFAQHLLWGAVLLDRDFRRAVLKFPRLVLAGACLPDLAMMMQGAGNPFAATHEWQKVAELAATSKCDEGRAIFAGYASHLLVDVVAHDDFVPAHEALWLDVPVFTHAVSEWAMDTHIAASVPAGPGRLLNEERAALIPYVAERFGCAAALAAKLLDRLAMADNGLRRAMIPDACYRISQLFDRFSRRRFNRYVRRTASGLGGINRLLHGGVPPLSGIVQASAIWAA